jgi:hypothetical protein
MRTIRTAKTSAKFIATLRETGGNVAKACDAINLSRTAAYKWKNEDPVFSALWEEAVEKGLDELEQEARRRALHGTDEPVFYKGEECGVVRKYSDTLAIFLLKGGRKEKYAERNTTINLNFSPDELSQLTDEQLDTLIRRHCK